MDIRKVLTNLSRFFVGLLFIFSGFIKANDPLGFSYKLEEYFTVFDTTVFVPFAIYIAMAICVFEIFVGFTLLLGVYKKFTVWMLLVMIVFFTFLTFYSAYYNKVTDCGCFGDAIKLTPWQSFSKDVILLVLILIIFFNQKYIQPLFDRKTGHALAYIGLIAASVFSLFAWYYLPPIDFRPYAVGKDLRKQMEIPEGAPKDSFVMTFIYEKNGQQQEFSMEDFNAGKVDSTWTFVDRKDKLVKKGYKPAIHDFAIYAPTGENITEKFLSEKGYRLMIVQYDLEKSNKAAQRELNTLIKDLWLDNKVKIWALSGSSAALISFYSKMNDVPYTFYQADATVLKTIIRANPGLVLYKDNVAVKMWPSTNLPSIKEIYSYIK